MGKDIFKLEEVFSRLNLTATVSKACSLCLPLSFLKADSEKALALEARQSTLGILIHNVEREVGWRRQQLSSLQLQHGLNEDPRKLWRWRTPRCCPLLRPEGDEQDSYTSTSPSCGGLTLVVRVIITAQL